MFRKHNYKMCYVQLPTCRYQKQFLLRRFFPVIKNVFEFTFAQSRTVGNVSFKCTEKSWKKLPPQSCTRLPHFYFLLLFNSFRRRSKLVNRAERPILINVVCGLSTTMTRSGQGCSKQISCDRLHVFQILPEFSFWFTSRIVFL